MVCSVVIILGVKHSVTLGGGHDIIEFTVILLVNTLGISHGLATCGIHEDALSIELGVITVNILGK